jgi:phage terminase small subunit
MATRGVKPKPAHLRIIDGTTNVTRHGKESDLRKKVEEAIESFGKLQRPKHLRGEALAAWRRYIEPAGWLDASREPAAIAFCELWDEFRARPTSFPASKHGQLRAYMSELGLTDERNRASDDSGKEKDEFFD